MHAIDRLLPTRLFAAIEAYRLRRRRLLTERILGEMPAELRKDIGWPDINRGAPCR